MSNYNDYGAGNGSYPAGNPGNWQGGWQGGQGGWQGGQGGQKPPKRFGASFFAWIRRSGMMRGDDRWIGGVCSGLAARLGWSPTLVRALVLGSAVLGGFGLALYAIAWVLLPDARDGRILAEELIAGRWDWNMLGAIIVLVMTLAIPGVGFAVILAAALVLWALVQSANRQLHGYGFGYHGPKPGQPGPYGQPGQSNQPSGMPYGSQPASSPYPYSPQPQSQPGTVPAQAAASPSTSYPYAEQSAPAYTETYPNTNPYMPQTPSSPAASQTASAQPQSGTASAAGTTAGATAGANANTVPAGGMPLSAAAPMTSPYRAPKSRGTVKVARRKPAGFVLTSIMFGLILVSAAIAVLTMPDLSIETLIRVSTFWIVGVCVVLGVTLVVLGVKGRRAGGLHPLVWLTAILAVCVLGTNVTYTVVTRDAWQTDGVWWAVPNSMSYGSTEDQYNVLRNRGVKFDGKDYDQSLVRINMTDNLWSEPHTVSLNDGTTMNSFCPTGEVTISTYKARVIITVPEGCTFAFSDGHNRNAWSGGINAIGSRYAMVDGLRNTIIGWDFDMPNSDFSADTDSDFCSNGSADWIRDSYNTMPVDGPELIINVPYAIQGKVAVRYQTPDRGTCPTQQLIP